MFPQSATFHRLNPSLTQIISANCNYQKVKLYLFNLWHFQLSKNGRLLSYNEFLK